MEFCVMKLLTRIPYDGPLGWVSVEILVDEDGVLLIPAATVGRIARNDARAMAVLKGFPWLRERARRVTRQDVPEMFFGHRARPVQDDAALLLITLEDTLEYLDISSVAQAHKSAGRPRSTRTQVWSKELAQWLRTIQRGIQRQVLITATYRQTANAG